MVFGVGISLISTCSVCFGSFVNAFFKASLRTLLIMPTIFEDFHFDVNEFPDRIPSASAQFLQLQDSVPVNPMAQATPGNALGPIAPADS